MKQETKDQNKTIRDRIKTLKSEILDLQKQNQQIVTQGQQLQQHLNNNNAQLLMKQGATEELEKTVK